MRIPHYLKSNFKNEMPREFIFFDVETHSKKIADDENEAVLTMGWCVYQRFNPESGKYTTSEWHEFRTIDSFWNFVFDKARAKIKLYLFAHNAGGFDLMVLKFAESLEKAGYDCTKAVVECPPLIMSYQRVSNIVGKDNKAIFDRTIILMDTLNFFRESLKSLGKAIGIEKMDYKDFEKPYNKQMSDYCKNDVLIISEAMRSYINFVNENNLGNFRPTTPSQAFNAFRHRFMPVKTLFCDCDMTGLELARQSYHGGRTEAFYIGKIKGKFYTLDVNSMYPHVMKNNVFPVSLWVTRTKGLDYNEMAQYFNDYFIIADLVVNIKEPKIPYIDKQGRLIFPIGQFPTTICQPEIELLTKNEIVSVNKIAIYNKTFIFDKYVDEFYKLKTDYKKADNMVYSTLSKLFLNSLYGKFGQGGYVYKNTKTDSESDYYTEHVIDADTGEIRNIRHIGKLIQELQKEAESSESIPAIASAVTSYARVLFWNYLKQAGNKHCYYGDTDSFLVDPIGYKNLENKINDTELGMLKLEGKHSIIDIRGAKDYKKDNIEHIKGIRLNSDSTQKINDSEYIQDTFRSLKGALHDEDVNRMIIKRTTKHLSRKYTKRIGNIGWLKPIVF